MVIRLAIGTAIALEEVSSPQLLVAVRAGEVLRMPRATQRRDYLSHDGFLAGVAAPFLGCLDSLTTHVGAEGSQHVVQGGRFWRRARCSATVIVFLPGATLAVHVRAGGPVGTLSLADLRTIKIRKPLS